MYIISQIFASLAFLFSLIAYHQRRKKKIMICMVISNILNSCHYFFLNSYSACMIKIVGVTRDSFMTIKDNQKTLNKHIYLYLFLLIYIIMTILTYKNITSLLPFLAATLYLSIIWDGNELEVKQISYITYFIWLAYNICVLSIIGISANIISLISSYIAYKREKKICFLK